MLLYAGLSCGMQTEVSADIVSLRMGNFIYQVNNFMIYITQLLYIHEGKEAVLDQFEAVAIPLWRPVKPLVVKQRNWVYDIKGSLM